jgi:hypothetical protein
MAGECGRWHEQVVGGGGEGIEEGHRACVVLVTAVMRPEGNGKRPSTVSSTRRMKRLVRVVARSHWLAASLADDDTA